MHSNDCGDKLGRQSWRDRAMITWIAQKGKSINPLRGTQDIVFSSRNTSIFASSYIQNRNYLYLRLGTGKFHGCLSLAKNFLICWWLMLNCHLQPLIWCAPQAMVRGLVSATQGPCSLHIMWLNDWIAALPGGGAAYCSYLIYSAW